MIQPELGGSTQGYPLVSVEVLRKAHLHEDKQIQSVEVFSTWMAFGGNTRDLDSFGEETDKNTTLHHLSRRIVHTEREDGVASIKSCRHDLSSDDVVDFVMASERSRLKVDLEPLTSILMDLQVTPTKHGRMTKPYSSPRFIVNSFNAGYLKMEVKALVSSCLKDSKSHAHTRATIITTSLKLKYMFQDFRYTDTFSNQERYEHVGPKVTSAQGDIKPYTWLRSSRSVQIVNHKWYQSHLKDLNKKNTTQDQQEGPTNFALMTYTSQGSSSSDTKAPTEGYGEAIVISEILAEKFEIKTNLLQDVSNDSIKLMLFPYSLDGAARVWDVVSKTDDRIDKVADQISNLVEIVNKQVIAGAKAVEKTCVTCGGAHAYYECIATDSNLSSVCVATGSYNQVSPPNRASHQIPPPGFALVQNNPNRFNQNQGQDKLFELAKVPLNENCSAMLLKKLPEKLGDSGNFFQNQPSTSGTLPSNNVPNPKGEMKAVTTCSGLAYEGPSIPIESLLEKVDEQNTKEILDKEHSNCSGSTVQVQPPVVPISNLEPDVPRTYFADALLLMPKFASTIKSLLANKDKLLRMEVCHALADLGESINLMPLSIWKKLSLPELTPTRITLELADRSITRPKGLADDVFVKVGKFHFLTDFVVVDFEADPRVPLILGRSFLRTGRALIDVYGEEITLGVNDESITFNLNQTMRYSLTYDDTSVNRVDVIDIACEDFVQDVLDFQYNPKKVAYLQTELLIAQKKDAGIQLQAEEYDLMAAATDLDEN
nr:hypothetical protein [Tanacetum cinerariifolium]